MLPSVVVVESTSHSSSENAGDDPPHPADSAAAESTDEALVLECPVCLQTCVHPVQLPCNHIFCFLCVKGVLANQRRRCALCRKDIPPEFLDNPKLVTKPGTTVLGAATVAVGAAAAPAATEEQTVAAATAAETTVPIADLAALSLNSSTDAAEETSTSEVALDATVDSSASTAASEDGGFQWFYEGFHGWWQYDERTSGELEDAHRRGNRKLELLIAGFIYVIDFENMWQYRRNDPSKRRRIKRDLSSISKKGIAGIRIQAASVPTSSSPQTSSGASTASSTSTVTGERADDVPPSALRGSGGRSRFSSLGDDGGDMSGGGASNLAVPSHSSSSLTQSPSGGHQSGAHSHHHHHNHAHSSSSHIPGTPYNTPAGPLTPASGASAASSAGGMS